MIAFWIRFEIHECPVCGRGYTYRERMPLPKPGDPAERYVYVQTYDWCEN